jgi:hypothetical protein
MRLVVVSLVMRIVSLVGNQQGSESRLQPAIAYRKLSWNVIAVQKIAPSYKGGMKERPSLKWLGGGEP